MNKPIFICCSGIVSPYHLANIYALIETYYADRKVELIISTMDFWGKSILPKRYLDYGKKYYNLKIENISLYELISNKDVGNTELVFVGVTYVNYLQFVKLVLKRKISIRKNKTAFFSIDEGLGSHGYRYFRTLTRQIKETNDKVSFFVKFTVRYCFYHLLDIVTRINHIRLFDISKGALVINECFKNSLKNVFQSLNYENPKAIDLPNNIMLYLDQPLSSINVCSDEYESETIPQLILAFAHEKNLDLMIKNHPSKINQSDGIDSSQVNNLDIQRFDGCIEELLSTTNCNNISVAGVTSNVLITAKLLYGVDSYSLRGDGIDLLPLELGNKIERLFSFFTHEIDLNKYVK